MSSKRLIFSQPYLEFLIPLLSFFAFLPLMFSGLDLYTGILNVTIPTGILSGVFQSNFSIYMFCSLTTAFFCWALNWLINSHDLLFKTNFLPSLLTLGYSASLVYLDEINVSMLSLPLLILAIANLLNSTGEYDRLKYLFNSGFFGGLAFLADPYLICALPVFLAAILIIRPPEFRGSVVFLIGILNVLILALAIDSLTSYSISFFNFQELALQRDLFSNTPLIVVCAVFGIVTFLGLAFLSFNNRSKSNRVKLKIRVLLLVTLCVQCFLIFWQFSSDKEFTLFYIIPAVVYLCVVAYLSGLNKFLKPLLLISHLVLFCSVLFYLFIK